MSGNFHENHCGYGQREGKFNYGFEICNFFLERTIVFLKKIMGSDLSSVRCHRPTDRKISISSAQGGFSYFCAKTLKCILHENTNSRFCSTGHASTAAAAAAAATFCQRRFHLEQLLLQAWHPPPVHVAQEEPLAASESPRVPPHPGHGQGRKRIRPHFLEEDR